MSALAKIVLAKIELRNCYAFESVPLSSPPGSGLRYFADERPLWLAGRVRCETLLTFPLS
jgi:hypothetical protein